VKKRTPPTYIDLKKGCGSGVRRLKQLKVIGFWRKWKRKLFVEITASELRSVKFCRDLAELNG